MQTRVAVMSIILEDNAHAEDINIICVAVDAPQDVISAMAGKLGRVRGANIKTAYSNFTSTEPEIKTE